MRLSFKEYNLSDEQAKALIFIREVGAINNAAFRNLTQTDTLSASTALRQLRDLGLIEARERGAATYYIPGENFNTLETKEQVLELKEQVLKPKKQVLEGKEHVLTFDSLPSELKKAVSRLGKKAPRQLIREVIIELCHLRDLTSYDLANILKRDQARLIRIYLTPMINESLLTYRYPSMVKHPRQAYRAK